MTINSPEMPKDEPKGAKLGSASDLLSQAQNPLPEVKKAMEELAAIKAALRKAPPTYPLPRLNPKAAATLPAIQAG
jgi:hypothetical protein